MAFKTTFRRLFALKIMHNFYLDGQNGTAFYDLPALDKQRALLNYDIRRDLTTTPTKETEHLMKARKMRYATDERGFFVGIEMNSLDEATVLSPLQDGDRLVFAIQVKNVLFQNISNVPLAVRDRVPLRYYFTNDDSGSKKAYPSVSTPLRAAGSRTYELGECVRQAAKVWEARVNNAPFSETNGLWHPFPNTFHEYVHAGDQRALPKVFALQFEKLTQVKRLTAELKDTANNTLKTINIDSRTPLSAANFDFSDYWVSITEGGKTVDTKTRTRDGAYKLSIKGDFEFKEQTVFLFDVLGERNCLGVIDIVQNAPMSDNKSLFRIQETDHTLPDLMPEFEVRFQNRLTYRRFFDNAKGLIKKDFNADIDTDFVYKDGVLTRKKADRLARAPLKLALKPDKTTKKDGLALPELMDLSLAQNKDKSKLFSDIQFFYKIQI